MKIIGVIPARYRSSRFPGKPLVSICGKPMIYWVYNQACKVKEFDQVYVATDDERIYNTCKEYNMAVIMTSEDCATGSDRVAEVSTKVEGDLFVNIQGDEPVIEPEMIRQVISIFTEDETVYFGSLKKYKTEDFYKDHQFFTIYTSECAYRYQIFAYYDVPETDEVYTVGFAPDETFQKFIDKMKQKSYDDTGVNVTKDDHIMTLSTCSTTGKRFVVHAVRIGELALEK